MLGPVDYNTAMAPDRLSDHPPDRERPCGCDGLRGYLYATALVAAATALGLPIRRLIEPTNIVMLYLAGVLIAGLYLGRGAALLASVLGTLAFDFFMVPPYLTLAVHATEYLVTFAGLLITSLVTSSLVARVREQAAVVKQVELLRATDQLQTALLDSLSHDLRTPLATITGVLSGLRQWAERRDQMLAASEAELLDTALEEAQRLNHLVGNLLDMTRLRAGALRLRREPTDTQDLIGAALAQMGRRLGDRLVEVSLAPDLPLVPLDFVLMVQVLVNLLDNAVQHSPAGAAVVVAAQIVREELEVTVRDRGPGIPAADLERVFERFRRQSGPQRTGGVGLGLAISRGIVTAHGGTIRAGNSPAGGAILTIRLPLAGGDEAPHE
ncbi:DUF4118 domain-containing protein [bacterium]|nr:DUF4118 domain-containing protein [bacterium]